MSTRTDPAWRTYPLAYVVTGGLVVGTLDLVFAMTFWAWTADVSALRVLQSVAAGVVGSASFDGGLGTALLGLGLHFFIAISMAIAYYVAARRWSSLWRRPVPFGAVYGLFLFLVMNLIVVPLSRASPPPANPLWVVLSVSVHVLLIGVPIALFVRQGLLEGDEP